MAEKKPHAQLATLPNEVQQSIYQFALVKSGKSVQVTNYIDCRTAACLLQVSKDIRVNMLEAIRLHARIGHKKSRVTTLRDLWHREEQKMLAAKYKSRKNTISDRLGALKLSVKCRTGEEIMQEILADFKKACGSS